MNCQEVCERAFREVFVPVLESEFPGVLERLSAGVVGGGSDSLGTDDELSRDHDWGGGSEAPPSGRLERLIDEARVPWRGPFRGRIGQIRGR